MGRRSARLAERSGALRRSPFRFLEAHDLLGLVLGRKDLLENDALCAALVCRTFRDQVFVSVGGHRLTTHARSVGLSVPRLAWARALAEPPPWLARWNEKTCEVLAHVGSKVGLEWAREGGCAWHRWNCVLEAANGGHVDVLVWLCSSVLPGQGAQLGLQHLAAACGVYEGLRGVCAGRNELLRVAASGGHVNVIRWAMEHGCNVHAASAVCTGAATGGHLAVLKWARALEPPCPWNTRACFMAAGGGHLELLKWARAQQPPCPWP